MKEFFAPSTYWKSLNPPKSFTMYGAGHITVIVLMFACIALLLFFGKRLNHKHIRLYIRVSAVFWVCADIFKTVLFLSTSGNIQQGLAEAIPLFMCSLFMYCLPIAAFGKGLIKDVGEYTITTLCLLSGLLTTVNCPALYNYPFFSFFGLHSVIYHAFMPVTGVMMLTSGYTKLELKRFYLGMIPIAILSVPAIIMNNLVNADYMLMRYAWGTPVLDKVAAVIGQLPQIFVMFFIYGVMAFVMTLLGTQMTRLAPKQASDKPPDELAPC